jgi:PAS domain-containing protein
MDLEELEATRTTGAGTFGIILYDEGRLIVAIDDRAALVLGKPSRELLGVSLLDFIPRPDRQDMAAARATFERTGEASGQYAVERVDGSLSSITYSVLANAPMPGLNLMAIAPSDAEVASDAARVRRIGRDVHPGLAVSEHERWFGTRPARQRNVRRPALGAETPDDLMAAVFPTEPDAWAALLAIQPKIEARVEVALGAFDGGWPRDRRSVLAVRGAQGRLGDIAAIVEEFSGTLITG